MYNTKLKISTSKKSTYLIKNKKTEILDIH